MKTVISEALAIFKDDQSHEVFRSAYVVNTLGSFIDGAVQNNEVPKAKADLIFEKGQRMGLAINEIELIFQNRNICLVENYSSQKKTKPHVFHNIPFLICLFCIVALLSYIVYRESHYAHSANPQRDSSYKKQALEIVHSYSPLLRDVKKAVEILKNYNDPEARQGLARATEIFMKWGDEAPNNEEARAMYEQALKYDQGQHRNEIIDKLSRLK